jgi:hypothetical protein
MGGLPGSLEGSWPLTLRRPEDHTKQEKIIVADQTLNIEILKEALGKD